MSVDSRDTADPRKATVAVEITRLVDDHFPGMVEFVLQDAHGTRWVFVDKVPVVTTEDLNEASVYPRPAAIPCVVVQEVSDAGAEGPVTIDTSRPWFIETDDGISTFVVHRSKLVEAD